jgi:hypothetical protein
MGVGDRHSKRTDKPRAEGPASRAAPPAIPVDDRELDDAFSAWDDDDAGAHQPSPAPLPVMAAQTRIERKVAAKAAIPDPGPASSASVPPVFAKGSSRRPAPLDEPLVDPVAMQDIVISRARTLHDPLTTRVLAELARKKTSSDAAIVLPTAPEAANAPRATPAEARSGTRTATKSPDPPTEQAPPPAALEPSDARITRQEIPSPRRRSRP